MSPRQQDGSYKHSSDVFIESIVGNHPQAKVICFLILARPDGRERLLKLKERLISPEQIVRLFHNHNRNILSLMDHILNDM